MKEKIWFLKDCDLFERLSAADKQHLESQAVIRTFPPGTFVYFPSDPGQSVLVLARGRVKIKFITPDGQETILAFVGPGELFGELAIVDTQPRNEYAEAVTETTVIAIPRDDMLGLMERRPELAMHVTRLFGFRRRRLENRLRNILFCSIRWRIVALMLELLETHGKLVGDAWEIVLPLSHQDLASLIGATRETVTVTLGQLQDEKLIRVQRRRLTVLDRARLAAEASAEGAGAAVGQASTAKPLGGSNHA
jgi:CRP/FNR family transcriptional regulator, cyclic AMP receptor protein